MIFRESYYLTGRRLWWYGWLNPLEPTVSSAVVSIDNEASLEFDIPEAERSTSASQALLFKTPLLEYAAHSLTLVHNGSAPNTKLTLQSLIIQKSMHSNTTATTAPKLPTFPPSTIRRRIAGITGGVGGFVLLLLVTCGIYALRRWTRRKRQPMRTASQDTLTVPRPFLVPTGEIVQVPAPRKARASQNNIDNPALQELQQPPLTKWTRRHTLPATFDGIPQSSSTMMERLPFIPAVNASATEDHSGPHATDLVTSARQSVAGNDLPPSPPTGVVATNPTGDELEHDSGLRMVFVPVLPPVYTTH